MKILFCIVLILVLLVLFAVWPIKRRDALRAPFVGHNCAHRGYFGTDRCKCTDYEVMKYRQKISGPIMDRMDIQKYVR